MTGDTAVTNADPMGALLIVIGFLLLLCLGCVLETATTRWQLRAHPKPRGEAGQRGRERTDLTSPRVGTLPSHCRVIHPRPCVCGNCPTASAR